MKNISYGIFAEDNAIKIFIQNAVPQLVKRPDFDGRVIFQHDSDFSERVLAINGQYVFDHFTDSVAMGFKRLSLDFCFVGLDCDDFDHAVRYAEMQAKAVAAGLDDRTIIFIPVQAIEYWLWYAKVKKDDSTLTNTLVIDQVEDRKEMKRKIYGRVNSYGKKLNPVVTQLSQNIDFDWLNLHSASFKHFYDLFRRYLDANFGKQP